MYIELKTTRLLLRPIRISDLETTHTYSSDKEVTKYMYYLPNKTLEDTIEFLVGAERQWTTENPDIYEFAVCFDGVHIGAIGLTRITNNTYDIGWILDKAYHGKGYCTEAAYAVVDFAKSIGAEKIVAKCDARNIRSYNVMCKLGMTLTSVGTRTYRDGRGTAKEYVCELNL